jgi:hypothetical protein
MNAPSLTLAQAASDWRDERDQREARERPLPSAHPPSCEAASPAFVPAYTRGLKAMNGAELLTTTFPPARRWFPRPTKK